MSVPTEGVQPESPSDESVLEPDDSTESPSEDTPEANADEPESPSDAVAPADSDDEPEEYRNALKKHGGDKAKLAAEFWRNQKRNAELAKKVADLEAKLTSGKVPPAEEKKPEPEILPPALQALEDEITALSTRRERIPEKANAVIAQIEEAREEIAVLKRDLANADEFDKPAIQARLKAAQGRDTDARDRYDELRERYDDLGRSINDRKARIEQEKARQQQAQGERAQLMQDFRGEVDDLVAAAAAELRVTDPDLLADLADTIDDHLIRLYSPFHLKGKPASDVDHAAAIKARAAKWAKTHGVIAKAGFAKQSAEKLKVTKPVQAAPRPAPTRQAPKPMTEAEREAARLAVLKNADKRAASIGLR